MSTSADVISAHKSLMFPWIRTYYETPIVADSAKGMWVKDKDGTQYLDFFGGILTVSIGHSHPRVTKAVQAQADKLVHMSTLYAMEPQVEFAKALTAKAPFSPAKVAFTSSGTEADEAAILLARLHTKNHDIVALRHGYHGRSALSMSLTAHAAYRLNTVPVPGIVHAHAPYCYRCPFNLEPTSCGTRCADDVEELIQTTTSGRIAGMLVEPILGVGGFITPPDDYFKRVEPIIRKYGGVLISDEVQTGVGRTGEAFWGMSSYGVVPDIMTGAKGTANGYAIGWTMARAEIADAWTGASVATFGGNPISMVAGRETLAVIEEENLQNNALVMGKRLRAGMEKLKDKYQLIGDVRGKGLMQAMELVDDRKTKVPAPKAANQLMEESKKEGILIGKGGLYGNVMRIAPALNATADSIDDGLARLDRAFARMPK